MDEMPWHGAERVELEARVAPRKRPNGLGEFNVVSAQLRHEVLSFADRPRSVLWFLN